MKFTILETVQRTSKSDKPYVQAACKANSKSGPYFFVATVPGDFLGVEGEEADLTVIFNQGSAYVLPY